MIDNKIIFITFYDDPSHYTTDYCRGILIAEKLKKIYGKDEVMVIKKSELNKYQIYNSIIIFVIFDNIYKHSGLTKKIYNLKI